MSSFQDNNCQRPEKQNANTKSLRVREFLRTWFAQTLSRTFHDTLEEEFGVYIKYGCDV